MLHDVYFAAPLFSDAEKAYNEEVVQRLEKYVNVFLPQRDGGLMVDMVKRMSAEAARQKIYQDDIVALSG